MPNRANSAARARRGRTTIFEFHRWAGIGGRYRALDCSFRTWGFVTIGSSRVLLTEQLKLLANTARGLVAVPSSTETEPHG